MGPCATCGQLTEPEADFCPECAGYAAPATVYSYAPSRLSRSDGELEQILIPLSRTEAPAWDNPPAEAAGGTQTSEPISAASATRSRSHHLAARVSTSAGRRSEGHWIVTAATLIVLIVATGTVLLLLLGRSGPASAPLARPAARTTTPAASPVVPPAPGPLISVAASAASSRHEAAVLAFLTSYFTAINDHDFTAYQQLFSPPLRADLSEPSFSAGYGTTTDSTITLGGIGVMGSGELVAQMTFVSHQQAAASPTNSACTAWSVSLYLLQQGGSYLIQQPPTGYQASYSACS
jgi:hypothetical protein